MRPLRLTGPLQRPRGVLDQRSGISIGPMVPARFDIQVKPPKMY